MKRFALAALLLALTALPTIAAQVVPLFRRDTVTGNLAVQNQNGDQVTLFTVSPTTPDGMSIPLLGATSGTTILQPAAVASGTLTLPAATDTLVGKATTDALTNKTLTLTAGTVSVAPLTLTAGSLLTSAAAGSIGYDGTAFYETPVASNRGVTDNEHFVSLTTGYVLTDSSAAQKAFNVPANGSIVLPATTSYLFELSYYITNTGTTSHTWSVLFGGTATLTNGAMQCTAASAASSVISTPLQGFSPNLGSGLIVTGASTSSTENVTIKCDGRVNINAAGTFIPELKLSAATGGAETVLPMSTFRMWAIGSNTVTNVGNWN